jgi:cobalt/nickel transport system ATP-binding protein
MNACGIEHLRQKPPHSLSAGEKKRAAIAGVAVMNPDIFVMDEPEAGLDPANTSRLTALIHQFRRQNKTVICATHNIDFAYEWADEWLILDKGQLLFYGDSTHFFEKETLRSIIEYPWAHEIGRLTGTAPLTKRDALQQLQKIFPKK